MGGRAKSKTILGGKRNLGRKPRAKDVNNSEVRKTIWDAPDLRKSEPNVAEVLAHPAYRDGYRLNQFLTWSDADKTRLRILAEAGVDVTKAADTLGRNEKTI